MHEGVGKQDGKVSLCFLHMLRQSRDQHHSHHRNTEYTEDDNTNEEVYEALQKSKLPDSKLSTIKSADIDKITPKELQLVSSSIRKYTSGYENKNGEATPMGAVIWGLLTSPDYKFKDFKAVRHRGKTRRAQLRTRAGIFPCR